MRLLLVGLGKIAWRGFGKPGIETHLQAILPNGAFELVGGVDPDGEARVAFMERTGVNVMPDLRVGLEATHPETVVICSPQRFHHEQVLQAADFPTVRGILVEKPMAETVSDCQDMIRACQDHVLLVAHQRRYEARHRAMRDYLRNGGVGEVRAASAVFSGDYLNNGTHAADACRLLVGDDVPWSLHQNRAGTDFSVSVSGDLGMVSLSSYGKLAPGYMTEMYLDFAHALQRRDHEVACTGEDGMEAVRHALFAQERDEHAA